MSLLPTAIIRGVQLILACIVLGLSVSLAKTQVIGSVPATTAYSSFVGGWGIAAVAFGVAALFFDPLGGIIVVAVDALTAVLYLAGGIAVFVGLKGLSCSADRDLTDATKYPLLTGGCNDDLGCGAWIDADSDDGGWDNFFARCKQDEADGAFMIIACITAFVVAGLAFWQSKKGTRPQGVVV
jgi:hypothetical protein